MTTPVIETSSADLLGQFNQFEAKFAPEQLWVRGDRSILDVGARVSIVGARKSSPDGLARARKLARHLAENGIVVVSGLAEGIDTAAHTAAMNAGGRTLAVIGTPIDKSYPAKNKALQEQIANKHLLVSQFAPGSRTFRSCFPQRNRTMALISDATVIVEASDSSGSLSQGWEALRLGRDLWITKSLVENPDVKWPATMLDYGAHVLDEGTLQVLTQELPERNGPRIEIDDLLHVDL